MSKEEGWVEWKGGDCPVPDDAMVTVELRDGSIIGLPDDMRPAWSYYWSHNGGGGDIIAYKVIRDEVRSKSADTNPKQAIGASKLPLHLVSPLAMAYMAVGLYNGAGKYGISNYKGTEVIMSIYLAAIMRHFMAIMEGEEFDPVDGSPHWGAILANIAIILDARAVGKLIDDRPIAGGYLKEVEKLTKIYQNLQELHKDKKPFHYTRNNMEQK